MCDTKSVMQFELKVRKFTISFYIFILGKIIYTMNASIKKV